MIETAFADRYDVTGEQRQGLRRNGHVLVRNLAASAELTKHRHVIDESMRRLSTEERGLESRDTYGKAFLQITNLWHKDDGVMIFRRPISTHGSVAVTRANLPIRISIRY